MTVVRQNLATKKWTRGYLSQQFGDRENEADYSNWDNHFMFYRGGVGPRLPLIVFVRCCN